MDGSPPSASAQNSSGSSFDGKVVIVDFWATWCQSCRKEVPGFIQLQKKYGDRGLVIIGVSFDQEQEIHDQWIRKQGLNYRSTLVETDEGKSVLVRLRTNVGDISVIPTTLVLDRRGRIIHKHVGYGSMEDFEKIVLSLL